MRPWLRAHAEAFAGAWRRLGVRPLESLLNVLTLAAALALPLFLYTVLDNLGRSIGRLDAAPQITVFLAPDSGEARSRIERELKGKPLLASLRFIGREQALQDLRRASGGADLLAGLAGNPLPDAYVLSLKTRNPAELRRLREQLASMPGVAGVEADSAWVDKVNALILAGNVFALLVGGLLAFAALSGVVNTIRLQLLTRREEIEVAALCGATEAYVRRPFLYFGVVQAALGALIACGIVAGTVPLLNDRLQDVLPSLGLAGGWQSLSGMDGVAILGLAALLGWLAARLSVAQYLRGNRS
jgi:cell division transport system permease protein